jgi:hypothetical protein
MSTNDGHDSKRHRMERSRNKTVIARLWMNSRLLCLIGLANGAPLLAKKLLGTRFSLPVDNSTTAPDHQAVFGSSKTLRGVLLSVLLAALGGWFLGFPFGKAALIGIGAMAGDLFSSFCKRRLHLPASSKAIGLDQVPESLFPVLLSRKWLSLKGLDVLSIVASFFLGELAVSKILYRFDLRDQPY